MKELKEYQIKAINELKIQSTLCLQSGKKEIIVFQAPTGSGKTITMARFIKEYVDETNEDLCFVWLSIGKGELQVQSKESVNKEIGDTIECSLLEEEFFGSREVINQNEIVFINWEKIRTKDRKTDEFKNILMKDSEKVNFPNVLKNTHKCNRKVILIIDESHAGSTTERAMELRNEIIDPDFTIEMSATPVLTGDMKVKIQVDPDDVINEGMIKKEVIINENIASIIQNEENEKTSEEYILEAAFNKQEQLKRLYEIAFSKRESKRKITPLTIIQLPNSNFGEEKKLGIERFLENKGITTENGKLAIWLSDEKINERKEILNALDSKVEYLIFKMAIDTGWDCPRAQILLKFREVNSITFEVQTVGRILRMPEAKHYSDNILNTAYVFSNIPSISIKQEIYNPNIIKTEKSSSPAIFDVCYKTITQVKNNETVNVTLDDVKTMTQNNTNEYVSENEVTGINDNTNNEINITENNSSFDNKIIAVTQEEKLIYEEAKSKFITLTSYYKKRIDYGDITSSFYGVFESQFCNYFGITKMDYIDNFEVYDKNREKLLSMDINFNARKKEQILSDVDIATKVIDSSVNIENDDMLVDIIMSDSELQYDFENVIKKNLNGFAQVRSTPTVKTAIFQAFSKYLRINPYGKGAIVIQNVVVNNENVFGNIINIATEKYKPIHDSEVEIKEQDFYDNEWHIPQKKYHNPNTTKEIESKLSYHKPLYIETNAGKVNQLELDFIKYLDKKGDYIEYFWKNGSEHMSTNFGIKTKKAGTFQPDFIVMFKDGRVGIFDTKAAGFNEDDNKEKSESLQQYIIDENKKGKNLFGGLVIKERGEFLIFDRNVYSKYSDAPEEWRSFEDILI